MTDRFNELNVKRTTTGLNAAESREFEALFNARSAVEHDPQIQQERAHINQQYAETAQESAFQHIFRTNINGYTADDWIGNRERILSWLDETKGEQLSAEWFEKVLQESPALAKQLAWSKVLSSAERKKQAAETALQQHERFRLLCRTHGLSECKANEDIINSVDRPVISTQIPGKPELITVDGDQIQLIPATQEEQQKWEQAAFDRKQQRLRELAASDTPQALRELKEISRRDSLNKTRNLEQVYKEHQVLKSYVERGEDRLPPLPDRWNGRVLDADFIRKADRQILRPMLERHGIGRVNARLFGYTEDFFTNAATKLAELEREISGVRSYSF